MVRPAWRHGHHGKLNGPSSTDPLDIFDNVPYCKGAAALADLRARLVRAPLCSQAQDGRDLRVFLALMRELYGEHAGKPLGSKELVEFLRRKAGAALANEGCAATAAQVSSAVDSWAGGWIEAVED